jgi:WD40 repeat protein
MLWDVNNEQLKHILEDHHDTQVTCVAFSADSQLLASVTENRIYLWDVNNEQLKHTLEDHNTHFTCVAFSADSQLLASVLENRIYL